MYPRFFKAAVVLLACGILAVSCGGPKIATADEQMARGEFFDAANTYRKLYNKYKKADERALRGEIALKMAQCYSRINMTAKASAAYQNAIRYGAAEAFAVMLIRE